MTQEETRSLELRDYLRVLRRHKWIIAATLVVCVGAALAMSLSREPVYSTSAQVLIEQRLVDKMFVPGSTADNPVLSDRRRANEIQVMRSPAVREEVEKKLGFPPEPVGFAPVGGTDVVTVISSGTDPEKVAQTANAYAETYPQVRTQQTVDQLNEAATAIQARIDDTDRKIFFTDQDLAANPPAPDQIVNGRNVTPTDVRVSRRAKYVTERDAYSAQLESLSQAIAVAEQGGARILADAGVPTEPTNKDPMKNLIAGLALGIVLAVALAFLREYLDDTVKTKEDLESATHLSVVGIIPALPDWKKRENTPLIAVLQPRSPAAEAYRSVRTSVEFLSLDQPIGSIQVTSAHASEGKTSTLANLAVTFARAGQRVIVLCCDLRRPRVHEFFGLSNRVGFTSILLGDTPLAQAIQPADAELPIGVVASGPLPPNPAELLASKRAVEVIEELDRRCDILMIDSPPILPVTDGLVLSGMVDGVLLVGSAGSSTKRGLKRATEMLRQVDAPLIGAILNGVGSKLEYGYSYGADDRYYLDATATQPKSADRSAKPSRKNGNGDGKSRTRQSARASR